ncbi:hypothetical protein BDN67DRAFT_976345 [Paxillus ammoniavirescens]|nr:hypothetical protein BDN67DRAFT_976345 [Paxillus ammoniavirescens]
MPMCLGPAQLLGHTSIGSGPYHGASLGFTPSTRPRANIMGSTLVKHNQLCAVIGYMPPSTSCHMQIHSALPLISYWHHRPKINYDPR